MQLQSHNVQDTPQRQSVIQPQMSLIAEVGKSVLNRTCPWTESVGEVSKFSENEQMGQKLRDGPLSSRHRKAPTCFLYASAEVIFHRMPTTLPY